MLQKLRALVSFPLETMQANAPQNEAIGVVFVVSPWCIRFVALAQSEDGPPPFSSSPLFSTSCFLRCGKVTGSERVVFNLSGAFDRCQAGRHSFSLAELRPLLERNR